MRNKQRMSTSMYWRTASVDVSFLHHLYTVFMFMLERMLHRNGFHRFVVHAVLICSAVLNSRRPLLVPLADRKRVGREQGLAHRSLALCFKQLNLLCTVSLTILNRETWSVEALPVTLPRERPIINNNDCSSYPLTKYLYRAQIQP